MPLHMTDDRQSEVSTALIDFFKQEFDEELSAFRAREIVIFMLGQIGPLQFNQAITDARTFMLQKLDDLDAEFYVDETP